MQSDSVAVSVQSDSVAVSVQSDSVAVSVQSDGVAVSVQSDGVAVSVQSDGVAVSGLKKRLLPVLPTLSQTEQSAKVIGSGTKMSSATRERELTFHHKFTSQYVRKSGPKY